MPDQPYTNEDLRAEAASSLDALVILPSPPDIGTSMRNAWVGSTLTGDGGSTWGELLTDPADFAAVQEKIHHLVSDAADLGEWAVNLGADGLEPTGHTLGMDADGEPLMRIHFAFHPDWSDADRDRFVVRLARFMADAD